MATPKSQSSSLYLVHRTEGRRKDIDVLQELVIRAPKDYDAIIAIAKAILEHLPPAS